MNIELKAVHFELSDSVREYVSKKEHRLEFAKDHIVDLIVTIVKDKDFVAEATINFRWGVSTHIKTDSYEIYEAIDVLYDKIVHKITKEKEKVQKHS